MAATPPTLLVEVQGPVCTFTLNRPECHNALDRALREELAAAVSAFGTDATQRVAVLTGAGDRAFSTGIDLRELAADADAAIDDGLAFPVPTLGGVPGFDEVRECRKPIIAAIDGWCLAGGFELALSCDIRVATRASVFGLPEARRGVLPGPGLHELPRLMPYGEALTLLLTGGTLPATRAVELGLVQRLAGDRDELVRIARELADEIAACAPLAVEATKAIVRSTRGLPLAEAWAAAEPEVRRVAASDDAREGPRAFVEHRAPEWTGH